MNPRRQALVLSFVVFFSALALGSAALAADAADAPDDGPAPEGALRDVLDRASGLFEQRDFEGARREYERASEMDPGSIAAWRGLGWSLWQLGQKDRALQLWLDVLKVQPDEPGILLALAQAYDEREQWDRALENYAKALRMRPTHRGARLARARIYQTLGKYSAAEDELARMLEHHPGDFEGRFLQAQIYRDTNRKEQALKIFQELARRPVEPKYFRYFADVMAEVGKTPEAIAYYRRSLAAKPGDRGATLGLARAYALDQRYGDAIEGLRRYLSSHPEEDLLRRELAEYSAAAGDLAGAEREWRALIRRQPNETKWPIELARLYQRQGRNDDAVAIAREVVAKDPGNVAALGFLADDALFAGRKADTVRWLEQLTAANPTATRLVQLGQIHIQSVETLDLESDEAQAAYRAAESAFRRAWTVDPFEVDGPMGLAMALRLLGRYDEAAQVSRRVMQQQPHLERARRELFETYTLGEEYDDAERAFATLQQDFPGSIRLQHQHAHFVFTRGDRRQAVAQLEDLLQKPLRPNVPVLLYHGITESEREDAMPIGNFSAQMAELQRAGYQSITVHDIVAFIDGKGTLPPKPVFITFDDARSDSFRNADPILKEYGMRATMFVPVGEIGQHGVFTAAWRTLREMHSNGRWDLQCHGYLAHRAIPIDRDGRTGRFLPNRRWLAAEGRLETDEEYVRRIDEDHGRCAEALTREVPGVKVVSYSYPFGDLGQKTLSNDPNAFEQNQKLVSRHFRVAFVQDPSDFVTRLSPLYALPRFEVPRQFSGEELLHRLKRSEPVVATLYELGDFHSWSERFDEATQVYDRLAREDVDRAELITQRGRVLAWKGDFAGARALLLRAAAMRPKDPILASRVETLDFRRRPMAEMIGSYFADNAERSSFGFGPSGTVHLSDRVSLAARYEYRELEQGDFPLERIGAAPLDDPEAETDFRAVANQVEGQIQYLVDWRNSLRLSGGVAEFSDQSSRRVFDEPDPVPTGSATLNLGLGDRVDASLGANRAYVGTAGAALQGLEFSEGAGQLRVRATERFSAFAQHAYKHYDDGNNRNTAIARLVQQVWDQPVVEIGYQFTFDDTREHDELFYTPEQFRANEGVFSLRTTPLEGLTASAAAAAGVGQERGGDAEPQLSFNAGLQWSLTRRFGLFVRGGRAQAARFTSVQGGGGMSYRF